jgi:hypothetical protein
MADLISLAKQGKVTEFEKEWARVNGITYPFPAGSSFGVQATDAYKRYKNMDDGGTKTQSSPKGNVIESVVKMMSAQEEVSYLPSYTEEVIKIDDVYKKIVDSQGKLNSASAIGKELIDGAIEGTELYAKQQTGLLDKINRQVGMTGDMAADFREELTNANPRLLQLGIGFEELSNAAMKLINQSGKFTTINQQTFERAGEVARAYVGTLDDLVAMYPEFERVGVGAADAQEKIAKAGADAIGLGLQSQKVTKDISANIGKLNEYGFKNGINGISEMARKATEFRMSMDSVFQVAEKVFDPDQAIELSANLQVLGGAIGDFNDPLKLMYMATNNVEGLQDALIGAASSLTTYNQEQGRFEITGVNLRRAREMAKQLGVDYKELAKGAIAAAERTSAASDLMARGLTLKEDQKEFITNLAQMKDGKMQIEINSDRLKNALGVEGKTVALENLTQAQADTLLRYQDELKAKTPEEIVRGQATSIENMKKDVNFIAALLRVQAGKTGTMVLEEIGKMTNLSGTGMAEATLDFTKKNGEEIQKMGQQVRDSITSQSSQVQTAMTKGSKTDTSTEVDRKLKEKEEANKTNTKNTTQPTTTTVEFKVKSDNALVDEISRYIMKNPYLLEMFKNISKRDYA